MSKKDLLEGAEGMRRMFELLDTRLAEEQDLELRKEFDQFLMSNLDDKTREQLSRLMHEEEGAEGFEKGLEYLRKAYQKFAGKEVTPEEWQHIWENVIDGPWDMDSLGWGDDV